ncbi:hypothetical protein [Texcoconibacillus texcoconensis]|uniref:Molybdopterin cofactor biosynthesis MoaD-related C-terminal domain-containing protein n=1 Tax=Texcoconibacillus texcoconensis TaxID=1095777 RepID=A0A840QQA0_9BACI|nr:hypothetical protein [Texcoconibacillus texcoconensis]MBB5173487.1 hypothetical protein [Texcoconibacillus texcoconensis]
MKETIEVRGIPRKTLLIYLQQIGGDMKEPLHQEGHTQAVIGEDWMCTVQPEKFFTFMHSSIPKVTCIFEANHHHTLRKTLNAFRKKTFRAGG